MIEKAGLGAFLDFATFPANPWEETKPKRAAVSQPGEGGRNRRRMDANEHFGGAWKLRRPTRCVRGERYGEGTPYCRGVGVFFGK